MRRGTMTGTNETTLTRLPVLPLRLYMRSLY